VKHNTNLCEENQKTLIIIDMNSVYKQQISFVLNKETSKEDLDIGEEREFGLIIDR